MRFVALPEGGSLILSVDKQAVGASECVLFAPEEGEPEVQYLLEGVETTEEADAACDRWLAYHGAPDHAHWLRARVDSAKFGQNVVPGLDCLPPNPIGRNESGVLRRFNAHPEAIRRACEAIRGVHVADPVAVGVDPYGVDVRARFGVVRLSFGMVAQDAEAAQAAGDVLFGLETDA